jgi:hypothetical protein
MTRSSFKYRAQKYYSRIPVTMKIQPISSFKKHLKQFALRYIPVR